LPAAERVTVLEAENAQLREDLATVNARLGTLSSEHEALKQQLEWFKRQLFGTKSEKRLDVDPAVQGNLLAALGVATPPPPKEPPRPAAHESGPTIALRSRPTLCAGRCW